MIKPIHPFPARMAPELAIDELKTLPTGSVVLDPMAGSGTVLRHALEHGHSALGFDMDPMAVLISRVWTTPVGDDAIGRAFKRVMSQVATFGRSTPELPWLDSDAETTDFVRYWFAPKQRTVLRRLAFALSAKTGRVNAARDVLRVALSRIIITKDRGASLGRDVSHSRPHKVAETSSFDVLDAFERSVTHVRRLLSAAPAPRAALMRIGDARQMRPVANGSVDVVLTSPPYLNAIDYIRGHRLALVWLGHRVSDLREVRSTSIGAERGPNGENAQTLFDPILRAMVPLTQLSSRHAAMVTRYAEDIYRVMSEIARVLRTGGRAVLIVGNSCLKDTFIKNALGIVRAGAMVGLSLETKNERRLPVRRRYLPMPSTRTTAPLGRRMRTESILSLRKT